jgi:hypothetical protein
MTSAPKRILGLRIPGASRDGASRDGASRGSGHEDCVPQDGAPRASGSQEGASQASGALADDVQRAASQGGSAHVGRNPAGVSAKMAVARDASSERGPRPWWQAHGTEAPAGGWTLDRTAASTLQSALLAVPAAFDSADLVALLEQIAVLSEPSGAHRELEAALLAEQRRRLRC